MSAAITKPEDVVISLERAKDLIARCLEVGDFTTLANERLKIEVFRAYARSRKLALEHQNAAAEVALRIDRALGTLLKDAVHHGGIRRGRPRKHGVSWPTIRLSDLGLSKKESSRCRQIAATPEPIFERYIATQKAAGEVITRAAAAQLGAMHRREVGLDPIPKPRAKRTRVAPAPEPFVISCASRDPNVIAASIVEAVGADDARAVMVAIDAQLARRGM